MQKGLIHKLIHGKFIDYSELRSEEGYHFYDKTVEIYREDENGEFYIVPEEEVLPEERSYMTYCSTPETTEEEINNRFVSVLIEYES